MRVLEGAGMGGGGWRQAGPRCKPPASAWRRTLMWPQRRRRRRSGSASRPPSPVAPCLVDVDTHTHTHPPWSPPPPFFQGAVYWAVQGQGAYMQHAGKPPRQLRCADVDLSRPGLVVVGSGKLSTPESRQFLATLRSPRIIQLGSSLKLLMVCECGLPPPCPPPCPRAACRRCWKAQGAAPVAVLCRFRTPGVSSGEMCARPPSSTPKHTSTLLSPACPATQVAEGTAHIYPRMAACYEWDTAASHIVVEEAGGKVLQAGLCDDRGNPLEDWKVGGHSFWGRGCTVWVGADRRVGVACCRLVS